MDLEKRIRMAAESILENETLREGLEDEAASALLDWGLACAKQIAAETAGLEDDTDAEEAVHPRMRALRGILRAVASLYAENAQALERETCLQEIADQVSLVYAPGMSAVGTSSWNTFVTTQSGSVAQKINAFRVLIENKPKARRRKTSYKIE